MVMCSLGRSHDVRFQGGPLLLKISCEDCCDVQKPVDNAIFQKSFRTTKFQEYVGPVRPMVRKGRKSNSRTFSEHHRLSLRDRTASGFALRNADPPEESWVCRSCDRDAGDRDWRQH